jgi:triosephosphate isomerase
MDFEGWASYLARGTGPARPMLIGGNWKCNGTVAQINGIINILNSAGTFPNTSEVVIATPSIHLLRTSALLRKDVSVASQDVGYNGNGAYTGEHSATMLKDAGVKWTLTGHSERRTGFGGPGETSEVVAVKTLKAIQAGMSVIVCIGEQLEDREAGKTLDVCISQLTPVVEKLTKADFKNIVIAYEPVWAIGTGKVATPQQAEDTHADIRGWLKGAIDAEVAKDVRIIYGGSVNAKNCSELIQGDNIDGFLVGGASLKPDFVNIINCTA